jgi:hypothetical protein
MMSQVPDDFRFAFKVTDMITIKKFPNLPRFGMRAGEGNADFLNADLFTDAFLGVCEPYKEKIGLLMFEFGRFYQTDFASEKNLRTCWMLFSPSSEALFAKEGSAESN